MTISPEGGVTVESREASDLLAIDERLTRQMADEAGTPRPRPFTVGMTTE